jgi:hypothetical protein
LYLETGPLSNSEKRTSWTSDAIRNEHAVILVASLVALIGSFVLQIDDGRVRVPFIESAAVSRSGSTCAFKRLTGIECGGCGLTRSFVSLAHGDVESAVQFNPVGPWIFILALLQIPYRALKLWRPVWESGWVRVVETLGRWIVPLLLVAMTSLWMYRIAHAVYRMWGGASFG